MRPVSSPAPPQIIVVPLCAFSNCPYLSANILNTVHTVTSIITFFRGATVQLAFYLFCIHKFHFLLMDIKSHANIIETTCQHTETWELELQLVNMLVCFYSFPISINFRRAISHRTACWLLRLSHCQCNCQKWNNWNVSIFITPINTLLDFYDMRRVWHIILIETLCKQMSTTYAAVCIC